MTDNSSPDNSTVCDQDTSPTTLSALEEHAIALHSTDPLAEFTNTRAVTDFFSGARIVALGEATHGTREFFQLKHRFLRHLVLEHGVRVFAMEANFPEALALDDYVVHGTGDPRVALENVYFWTWNVESVLSMVEWLREFNHGRPLSDRVRFYGFDAQYTTGAVSRLDSYLDRIDASVPRTVRDDLELVDDGGTNPDQDEHTDDRLDAGERIVPRLRDHLDEQRAEYVDRSDERAFELARRQLAIIEQATEYRRARTEYDGEFGGDLTDRQVEALEALLTVRDRAMADNVDWLLGFEDADRIVLWAHDAHVNRQKHQVRGTGAVAEPMGKLLAERHGEEYVAVGFSFGGGTFQAMGQVDEVDGEATYDLQGQTLQSPVSGTIDETLAVAPEEFDAPVALFDLRTAGNDDRLDDLLDEPLPRFSAGAMYDGPPIDYLTEYVFGDAFDAICFVSETTRARPLGAEVPE